MLGRGDWTVAVVHEEHISRDGSYQAWILPVVYAPFYASTPTECGAGCLGLGTPSLLVRG